MKIVTLDSGSQSDARPLRWLDMSSWDEQPIPSRRWAIHNRVPANQAGLFSGEGGAGKSIIELLEKRSPRHWEGLARVYAGTGPSDLYWRGG